MESTAEVTRLCGDTSIEAGRGPGQLAWYAFAKRYLKDCSVLDVGCGLGKGTDILRSVATHADGQDLDPQLSGLGALTIPLAEFPAKSYDVVVSIEVVEHVEDPTEFVSQLARIARKGIFITTPNWTASRCTWPFHLREYTPKEFFHLLAPAGTVHLMKLASDGDVFYPVKHVRSYFLLNRLRCAGPTSFLTRCVNRILPIAWRIHSHNAAFIDLRPLQL